MTGPDDALEGQRRIWTIGDYPAIARHLRAISLQVLDTVGVTDGPSEDHRHQDAVDAGSDRARRRRGSGGWGRRWARWLGRLLG